MVCCIWNDVLIGGVIASLRWKSKTPWDRFTGRSLHIAAKSNEIHQSPLGRLQYVLLPSGEHIFWKHASWTARYFRDLHNAGPMASPLLPRLRPRKKRRLTIIRKKEKIMDSLDSSAGTQPSSQHLGESGEVLVLTHCLSTSTLHWKLHV